MTNQKEAVYDLSFVNYTTIELSKDSSDATVKGVAVSYLLNSHYLKFTDQAIESAIEIFNKSRRKPRVLIDHEVNTKNVVGVVKKLYKTDKGLGFEMSINPKHPSGIFFAIERGDVDAVSIGGTSTSIKCSICGEEIRDCEHYLGQDYEGKIAYGLVQNFTLKELSITAFPADEYAQIDSFTVAQSINIDKFDLLFGPSYQERKNLPDSSFAMPKERKLPYKDANGKIVCKWVRDALRLAPKVKGGVPEEAMRKLRAAAKQCGIETNQSTLSDKDDSKSEKNTEMFINDKNSCGCDNKMSEENKEIKMKEKATVEAQNPEGQERILQAALEKLSKENQELLKRLEEQEKFIQAIKQREREEKIERLLKLTSLKREELEQYSDEALDASLKMLEKVVKTEEKPMSLTQSRIVQPKASNGEEIKQKIRKLFGFPEPTEYAKERAHEITQMLEKGYVFY